MNNGLYSNIDKIHATDSTLQRISRNMGLEAGEVISWCKRQIENPDVLTRTDKSWNVRGEGFVIMIDTQTFAILTARRERIKKGSNMENVSIVGKLDDIPELKRALMEAFDAKTHRNVSRYALLLADHILWVSNMPMSDALEACYSVNRRWQNGDAGFQEARNVAGVINDLAREEKEPVKEKALRAMGQIAATPHVKRHALIASDYAVKVINLLYPGSFHEVRKERELQIHLMKSV